MCQGGRCNAMTGHWNGFRLSFTATACRDSSASRSCSLRFATSLASSANLASSASRSCSLRFASSANLASSAALAPYVSLPLLLLTIRFLGQPGLLCKPLLLLTFRFLRQPSALAPYVSIPAWPRLPPALAPYVSLLPPAWPPSASLASSAICACSLHFDASAGLAALAPSVSLLPPALPPLPSAPPLPWHSGA